MGIDIGIGIVQYFRIMMLGSSIKSLLIPPRIFIFSQPSRLQNDPRKLRSCHETLPTAKICANTYEWRGYTTQLLRFCGRLRPGPEHQLLHHHLSYPIYDIVQPPKTLTTLQPHNLPFLPLPPPYPSSQLLVSTLPGWVTCLLVVDSIPCHPSWVGTPIYLLRRVAPNSFPMPELWKTSSDPSEYIQ